MSTPEQGRSAARQAAGASNGPAEQRTDAAQDSEAAASAFPDLARWYHDQQEVWALEAEIDAAQDRRDKTQARRVVGLVIGAAAGCVALIVRRAR